MILIQMARSNLPHPKSLRLLLNRSLLLRQPLLNPNRHQRLRLSPLKCLSQLKRLCLPRKLNNRLLNLSLLLSQRSLPNLLSSRQESSVAPPRSILSSSMRNSQHSRAFLNRLPRRHLLTHLSPSRRNSQRLPLRKLTLSRPSCNRVLRVY